MCVLLPRRKHALISSFDKLSWETVFTAGFELDVLRRKRPYRWTIWLYLGTRYTLFLSFIFLLIDTDGPRVPCEALIETIFTLTYASWAFATFIIILRVIAIWNRNIVVSVIAVGLWLCAAALSIRHIIRVSGTVMYYPIVDTCTASVYPRRPLIDATGIFVPVVDIVLLLTMLIGLLRHASKSSTGIWKLLYQQCIIWLALAFFAEIPPLVFAVLNLNDIWDKVSFITP